MARVSSFAIGFPPSSVRIHSPCFSASARAAASAPSSSPTSREDRFRKSGREGKPNRSPKSLDVGSPAFCFAASVAAAARRRLSASRASSLCFSHSALASFAVLPLRCPISTPSSMSFCLERICRRFAIIVFESRTASSALSSPARYAVFHPVRSSPSFPSGDISATARIRAARAALALASPQSSCTSGKLCTACSPYSSRASTSFSSRPALASRADAS
mmetsp:Transcript_8419/g.35662  ORF Transcript_8419/g.35662 Transcript_8419/m.35662 type:complete len:219 (+) Transcript_8419:928-1584(+)